MEEKELLEKIENPEDKRSAYLKLKKDAHELVDKLRKTSDQLNKDILNDFEESEIKNMKEYLLRIDDKLEVL